MSKKNIKNKLLEQQSKAMPIDTFWCIIQKAHDDGACKILGKAFQEDRDYSIVGLISTLLSQRSLKTIIQFEITLRTIMWRHRPMALSQSIEKILGDNYSRETEYQFVLWLITQGKQVFNDALDNPKSIVKKYKQNYNLLVGDDLMYCAQLIFNRKSDGKQIDDFIDEHEARMKYDISYALSHLM